MWLDASLARKFGHMTGSDGNRPIPRFSAAARRYLLAVVIDKKSGRTLTSGDITRLEQEALPQAAQYMLPLSRTNDLRGLWLLRFRRAVRGRGPKDPGEAVLNVLEAALAPRAEEAGQHAVVLIGLALDVQQRDVRARARAPATSVEEFAQLIRAAVADLSSLRAAIESACLNAPGKRRKPSKVDAVQPIWEVAAELGVPMVSTGNGALSDIVARCFEAIGLPESQAPRAVRDFIERESRERNL